MDERCCGLDLHKLHKRSVTACRVAPGRQRDVSEVGDAAWLAEAPRHGLLRPSFVPDRAAREPREVTRYRGSLVRERTAEVNRRPKTREGATSK